MDLILKNISSVDIRQLQTDLEYFVSVEDFKLSEYLKPLSKFEIVNNHDDIVKKTYKGFNGSIKVFKDIDQSKIPLIENICKLSENKIIDEFIQKNTNEIQVVRWFYCSCSILKF